MFVMPQEEVDAMNRDIAELRKGNIENQITAILMDGKIGGSGMYRETAEVKAKKICKLIGVE